MAQLKNAEGIVGHLQKIFYYGDEAKEQSRVNSFIEYLATKINPFTEKPYEVCARSLYRYISGDQHYPVDLMNPLIDWSADERLMADYNIRPSAEALDKLTFKRDRLMKERERLTSTIEMIDSEIDGAVQLNLVRVRKGK